jgi:hypothetical protein
MNRIARAKKLKTAQYYVLSYSYGEHGKDRDLSLAIFSFVITKRLRGLD